MLPLWEIAVRIAAAVIAGGIVGAQREYKRNTAGFRTHMLVSLGACIAMLTNEFLLHKYGADGSVDIARMGSYVISGIGFLGAGSIIKDGLRVRGLTTAAGLWVVACLGIAAGAGFYTAVGIGVAIVIIIIVLMKFIEVKFMHKSERLEIDLSIKNTPGQLARIMDMITSMGVSIRDIQMDSTDEKWVSVLIRTTLTNDTIIDEFTSKIDNCKGVKLNSISEE